MTTSRKFLSMIIAGAAAALAPSIASASQVTVSATKGPITGTVIGTIGNNTSVTVTQSNKINGAAIGSIGNGTSQSITQKGASNTSLEIEIGVPLSPF